MRKVWKAKPKKMRGKPKKEIFGAPGREENKPHGDLDFRTHKGKPMTNFKREKNKYVKRSAHWSSWV